LFDLLGDMVEVAFALDCDAEKCLFKLLEGQSRHELFGHQFVLGEVLEDGYYVLRTHEQCRQLKGIGEIPPGFENDLVVVVFLGQGLVGEIEEELKEGLEVLVIVLEKGLDGFAEEELLQLFLCLLFDFDDEFGFLLDLLAPLQPFSFLALLGLDFVSLLPAYAF